MKIIIQWTNKYSKEKGYVKTLNGNNKYFENTFDVNCAKIYSSKWTAKRALDRIIEYGEAINNDFEIIEL